MIDRVRLMEKEAQGFLSEKKYEEALKLFSSAAASYQDLGEHQQAAVCFALAAGCYESKAGAQSLYYYASAYYAKAAKEAEVSGDFEYAGMLYKHAGICYERDLEFVGFSECFYLSKECYRKSLLANLLNQKRTSHNIPIPQKFDFKETMRTFILWVSLSFSSIIWGHGERPWRTVRFGSLLVLLSAVLYTQGHFMVQQAMQKSGFLGSLYFSVVTITHIGYGDMLPVGFNKAVAIFEEFAGIFILPLFLTALCRKYLRF